jgi:F-type H+-transporting ATPase subunit b
MLANPTFWVGVAFFIFFFILWKNGVHRSLARSLDARGDTIRRDLDEARQLRQDAENLLKEYQAKRAAAEKEAVNIVAAAKEEAERLSAEAEMRLNEFIKRRTAAAEAKIAQAEIQAMADVRAAAAQAALKASEVLLKNDLSGQNADAFLAKSLQDISSKLN